MAKQIRQAKADPPLEQPALLGMDIEWEIRDSLAANSEAEYEQEESLEPDKPLPQEDVSNGPGAGTYLDFLLTKYRQGKAAIGSLNSPVNFTRVAEEIVGYYRGRGQCLRSKVKGVSYDGSLLADLKRALESAEHRGRILEHLLSCNSPGCCRCLELNPATGRTPEQIEEIAI